MNKEEFINMIMNSSKKVSSSYDDFYSYFYVIIIEKDASEKFKASLRNSNMYILSKKDVHFVNANTNNGEDINGCRYCIYINSEKKKKLRSLLHMYYDYILLIKSEETSKNIYYAPHITTTGWLLIYDNWPTYYVFKSLKFLLLSTAAIKQSKKFKIKRIVTIDNSIHIRHRNDAKHVLNTIKQTENIGHLEKLSSTFIWTICLSLLVLIIICASLFFVLFTVL